ncbi:hypothetical protein CPB85DRAFT_1229714 [Mucidula mucida]|nr:hypothetical protein CPB85DRAFT_1229714 [Mucidula mucida]
MPADPSSNRRTSRKHSTDDDIDVRRARGEISCAECRRLKLKCDKKLPCGSCIRRGCPSICPNGSLATGQGTRFVLADTSQLHNKISEMGQRIRQLEDALAIFQAGVSTEVHPLLREDLLAIKFGPDATQTAETEKRTKDPIIDSIDALGTLTIGDRGEGKYFGRSAGSEVSYPAGAELEMNMTCADDDPFPPVALEIARLSNTFPFTADGGVNWESALDLLFDHLPERPRAWALCETYLEHASWTFRPIRRDEIVDDILTPIYKCVKDRGNGVSNAAQSISAHKLAVLFILFSLGALVDLTLEPYNFESDNYYHLSRAALSLRSVFDSPEISTVQAVVLLGSYHAMGGKRYTMDSAWSIMSLGAKLAQSFILHLFHLDRDSARWKMDSKTVQRRRALFYEIFCADLFYSMSLGRPPSIRLSYIDCEYPRDEEATLDDNGDIRVSYYQWKYEFCREIFSQILELTLTAEAPSYQLVLDLDRKVRQKTLPPHLNVFLNPDDDQCTPSAYMHGCLLGQYRTITLLYIHRSFFAQAMLDHPINPLRSPYAPSFLAAYRCASGVIKSSLNYHERFPVLCGRIWGIWTHLFSAAIIVGSIVTRSPSSSMAANAFIELGLACDLFEKGALSSRRARSGFGILTSLKNRAFQIYSQFRSGNQPIGLPSSVGADYGEDELALFGGQTRVLFSKLMSKRGVNRKPTATTTASSPLTDYHTPKSVSTDSQKDAPSPSDTLDVHPSLVEYLSMLPPTQHPHYTPPHEHTKANASSSTEMYGHLNGNEYHHIFGQATHEYCNPFPSSNNSGLEHGSSSLFGGMEAQSSFSSNAYQSQGPSTSITDAKLLDFGMMMTGDSGMDEQWKSFMRDSGLIMEKPCPGTLYTTNVNGTS